ncbi:MAG: 1-phosphofructokinase, partial [Lachnospiraceae bacterium]|nr:1-phosphofructokinase [Lachnospiraceae bacterium]
MIYTVTFNPSLDYIIRVDNMRLGVINRTYYENILPGGKGINVSIVLKNLGHESTALGFMAGFTGREIGARLESFGVASDFIEVQEGLSRINVKVKSNEETEINGQGPKITEENIEALYAQLDRLAAGDMLIISGSVPNTLPGDMYERIMERLEGRGI